MEASQTPNPGTSGDHAAHLAIGLGVSQQRPIKRKVQETCVGAQTPWSLLRLLWRRLPSQSTSGVSRVFLITNWLWKKKLEPALQGVCMTCWDHPEVDRSSPAAPPKAYPEGHSEGKSSQGRTWSGLFGCPLSGVRRGWRRDLY